MQVISRHRIYAQYLFSGTTGYYTDNSQNSVCVRSGLLAGLLALASTVLCFLSLALTVMCYRSKRLVKGCADDPAHHVIAAAPARCFLTHKGRINWWGSMPVDLTTGQGGGITGIATCIFFFYKISSGTKHLTLSYHTVCIQNNTLITRIEHNIIFPIYTIHIYITYIFFFLFKKL